MSRNSLLLNIIASLEAISSKQLLRFAAVRDATEHEKCVHPTLISEDNISAEVVANHEEVARIDIIQAVLLFHQLKAPSIRLAHDDRRLLAKQAGTHAAAHFDQPCQAAAGRAQPYLAIIAIDVCANQLGTIVDVETG